MEIMNLFRQFKLGNSLFQGQYRLPLSITPNFSQDQLDEMIRRKMVEQLTDLVFKQHNSAITQHDIFEPEVVGFDESKSREYRVELLVLKMADFKSVVEAAIQLMPMRDIDRIKQGEVVL